MIAEPEMLLYYLDTEIAKESSTETRIKGYRVKMEYSAISEQKKKNKPKLSQKL